MFNLEDTLNFMKKHFFQSWLFVTSELKDIWNTRTSFYCFRQYLSFSYSHYKYTFKKWLSKIKHIRIAKLFCKKLRGCDYIITYDEYCTPCISIMFTKRKDADIKDILKDVILYEKVSNTYFKDLDINPMFILGGIEKEFNSLVTCFYDKANEIKSVLQSKGNKNLQEYLYISKVIDMKIGGVI